MKHVSRLAFTLMLSCLSVGAVSAKTVLFSTLRDGSPVRGLSQPAKDGDIIYFNNSDTPQASIFFPGETTLWPGSGVDIDAFHVLPSGEFVFSHEVFSVTLNGQTFTDGDLVKYNPVTLEVTEFLDESVFSSNADIDAVFVRPENGNIVLSTNENQNIGGISFREADIIEYDPVTRNVVAVLFSEDRFEQFAPDVDAVHILQSGNIVLSVKAQNRLDGLPVKDGDLVEWDPVAEQATMFLNESDLFLPDDNSNVDALHVVPLPPAVWLFGSALVGLVAVARRSRGLTRG